MNVAVLCPLPHGTPTPQAQDWTSFVQGKPGKWHYRATEVHQGGCGGERRSFRSPQLENTDNSGCISENLLMRRVWNKGGLWAFCCRFTSWQNRGMYRLNQHLDEDASCAGRLQELPDFGTALTAAPEAAGSEIFPMHLSLWEQSWHWRAFISSQGKPNRERNPCLLHAALCSHHLQSLSFKRTWMANEGEKYDV